MPSQKENGPDDSEYLHFEISLLYFSKFNFFFKSSFVCQKRNSLFWISQFQNQKFKVLMYLFIYFSQATVDTIKGNFGFLSYEAEEGKKLFFHMSEVKGEGIIQSGDKVEFVVVHHQKTGKYSACSVVKIG